MLEISNHIKQETQIAFIVFFHLVSEIKTPHDHFYGLS